MLADRMERRGNPRLKGRRVPGCTSLGHTCEPQLERGGGGLIPAVHVGTWVEVLHGPCQLS